MGPARHHAEALEAHGFTDDWLLTTDYCSSGEGARSLFCEKSDIHLAPAYLLGRHVLRSFSFRPAISRALYQY